MCSTRGWPGTPAWTIGIAIRGRRRGGAAGLDSAAEPARHRHPRQRRRHRRHRRRGLAVLPTPTGLPVRVAMMVGAVLLNAFATVLYIGAAWARARVTA